MCVLEGKEFEDQNIGDEAEMIKQTATQAAMGTASFPHAPANDGCQLADSSRPCRC